MTHEYGMEYSITFKRIAESDRELFSEFRCENQSISTFLKKESLSTKKDVTYLFIDEENNRIIGFCSLCCHGISITRERKDGTPYNTSLPSVEIDFFAIDEDYRKIPLDKNSGRYDTLSNALFSFVLNRIKNIAEKTVGATHICLYSVPRAENFYKRCGFVPFETFMNPDEKPFIKGCTPMFKLV